MVGEIARPLRRATRAGLTAALFDIHPGSGICYVMPGTHRTAWPRILAEILAERPEFSQTLDRFATDRAAAQAGWRRDIRPLVFQGTAAAIAGVPRVTFPLDKGDVVLFSPSVIHGTMARSDAMLPRKVMISEWRARIAMIHHPGEHFGVAYDHRQRPGAGIPADRDAMHSSLGLCCDPYRPAYR